MFSSQYFTYLLQSKKILLAFIGLVYILCAFTAGYNGAMTLIWFISVGLSFILPVLLFSHVHDKRAVDTYFQLPLKRDEILVTTIIFIIATIYIPSTVSVVISSLIDYGMVFDLTVFLPLLGFSALVVVNSYLFMLANTIFDGVVIMTAYEALPAVFYMLAEAICSNFIAGYEYQSLSFVGYLSPVINSMNLAYEVYHIGLVIYAVIFSVINLVVFSVLLYRSYTLRKAERAGTSSSYLLAYPTVIKLYAFSIIMIFMCESFGFKYYKNTIMDNMFFYIMLFAVYVAAHFVYKRKFYFDIKMPLFYICAFVLSMVLCFGLQKTKGLGLAYRYISGKEYTYYYINCYSMNDTENTEIRDFIEEKTYTVPQYFNVNITSSDEARIDDEVYEILVGYRHALIEDFYNRDSEGNYFANSFSANNYSNEFGFKDYYYYGETCLTLNQIKTLAKYPYMKVLIETDNRVYKLTKNEELILVEDYEEGISYDEYAIEVE